MDGNINFSLEGSLIDLNTQNIPNFNRPSPVYLERVIDGSLQLYVVDAYRPAFYSEDGSYLIEPFCINECTWNRDLSKSVWVKGGNITVKPNNAVGADGGQLASTISWIPGDGSPLNQLMTRAFALNPEQDYHISLIAKLRGGQFTNSDVMQLVGDVVGSPSVSLSSLNHSLNRYFLMEMDFRTAGKRPKIPNNIHQASDYTIAAFDQTTITLAMTVDAGVTVVSNQFVGGQISISTVSNSAYTITASTLLVGGTVTFTTTANNLIADGVTLSARAFVKDAPPQNVSLQLISNSSAVIDWDSLQIEARNFRTSMNYQEGAIQLRAQTNLKHRRSPLRSAKTFGIYGELVEWRGDGNVFKSDNISAWISEKILYVQAGATVIQSRGPVSSTNLRFFVQVASENASLSLYVNGVLEAKTTVANFTVNPKSSLDQSSLGFRRFQIFLTTDSILADGQVAIGQNAIQQVGNLFSRTIVIDPVAISSHAPTFLLPPITIPAPDPPIASSQITGLSVGSAIVTVMDSTGFVNGAPVTVLRGTKAIQYANITNKNGANITLSTVSSIVIGDTLVYGNVDQPGRIACRFPFDPLDSELIQTVDTNNKKLTLPSALAFTNQRAFVHTDLFQDVAEVLVQGSDTVARTLTVDNINGVNAGMFISQPENELFIDTPNYFASLVRSVDNVRIAQKYQNGIVLENRNPVAVVVRPVIRVYL